MGKIGAQICGVFLDSNRSKPKFVQAARIKLKLRNHTLRIKKHEAQGQGTLRNNMQA